MSDTLFCPLVTQFWSFVALEMFDPALTANTPKAAGYVSTLPRSPNAASVPSAGLPAPGAHEGLDQWDGVVHGWGMPERSFGNSVRGKRVDLIYRLPMRETNRASNPVAFSQVDVHGSITIATMTNMPEASPISPYPAAAKYGCSITCPPSVHDVDATAIATWAAFGGVESYRVYGGTNSPATGTWISPSVTQARINTIIPVSAILNDVNFDDITYVLKADGVTLTQGTVPSGTTISYQYLATYATTSLTFSLEMVDSLGATSSTTRSILVADVPALIGAITSPTESRLREGMSSVLAFDAVACTWAILDNGATLFTGNANIAGSFKTPWLPVNGVHALTLRLTDAYGSQDIAGPTVTVIPWRDLNSA